jgi:hypothetical protein
LTPDFDLIPDFDPTESHIQFADLTSHHFFIPNSMMTKPDYYKLLEVPTPNYDAWEFHTHISAKSKGLLDTIFGDDTEPSTGHNSKGWKAWKARQDSAAELIVKSLGDDQLVHVRGLEDDLKLMWERLRTVHEKTGTGSALGLWKSFHNLMYTDFSIPL